MHCNLSEQYTNNPFNHRLLEHLQEALEDIESTFNVPVVFGVPNEQLASVRYNPRQNQTDLFVRDVRTRGGFFLDPPQRVFVLPNHNWCANPHLTGSQAIRGRYLYRPAVILLHENGDNHNSWCRQTLIHEILHSVSLYSRIWDRFPNVIRLHEPLIEGITECLVGYILYNRHPDCYQGWKTSRLYRCSVAYRNRVKLWCSLCQCVGIEDIANFYLATKENPTEVWDELIKSIHLKGYKKFDYQLDFTRAFREAQFRQICVDSFSDFREIYDSLTKSLDFSQIP